MPNLNSLSSIKTIFIINQESNEASPNKRAKRSCNKEKNNENKWLHVNKGQFVLIKSNISIAENDADDTKHYTFFGSSEKFPITHISICVHIGFDKYYIKNN